MTSWLPLCRCRTRVADHPSIHRPKDPTYTSHSYFGPGSRGRSSMSGVASRLRNMLLESPLRRCSCQGALHGAESRGIPSHNPPSTRDTLRDSHRISMTFFLPSNPHEGMESRGDPGREKDRGRPPIYRRSVRFTLPAADSRLGVSVC